MSTNPATTNSCRMASFWLSVTPARWATQVVGLVIASNVIALVVALSIFLIRSDKNSLADCTMGDLLLRAMAVAFPAPGTV